MTQQEQPPRTEADAWQHGYEACYTRMQDAGRLLPAEGREAATPSPDALREALGRIEVEGCQAWRFYDAPEDAAPGWDFCLNPDNRESPLTGDADSDRCWPCLSHAALAATPSPSSGLDVDLHDAYEWIAEQPAMRDWACAHCDADREPGSTTSDILIPGFTCTWHKAVARLQEQER